MEFDEWNFRHAWWVGLCCFFRFLIPRTVQRFKITITHLHDLYMYCCSLHAPLPQALYNEIVATLLQLDSHKSNDLLFVKF